MSEQSFAALGVSAEVSAALAARGFEFPFQVQSLVLPPALRGQDVLAKAPTGSGKTLAFALTIVERLDRAEKRPSALVLVPTRELAVQVTEEFQALGRSRGLSVVSVYGGVPLRSQGERARVAHVIVATPGRRARSPRGRSPRSASGRGTRAPARRAQTRSRAWA